MILSAVSDRNMGNLQALCEELQGKQARSLQALTVLPYLHFCECARHQTKEICLSVIGKQYKAASWSMWANHSCATTCFCIYTHSENCDLSACPELSVLCARVKNV